MSCERITPLLPRAPSRAARATDSTISSRPISSIVAAVAGQAVELGDYRVQRQRHVVARVAVGDREHVEVIDLLAAFLQLRERGLDDRPKPLEVLLGHARNLARLPRGAGLRPPW
jgi:hypothetical protein